jgi:hypothetical protein
MHFRVRGMGVKKQNAKPLEEIKKDFSTYLKTKFWNYFKNGQSFSAFHNKACNEMIDIFSKRYNNVSYGKAQKAINELLCVSLGKFLYFLAKSLHYFNKCSIIKNRVEKTALFLVSIL